MFRKAALRVLCISVVMALWVPLAASAKTLYVKSNGSGSSCSKSKPCSMKTGIGKARRGDTVIFKSGTYTKDNLVTKSDRVTFKAEKKGKAIIKPKKSPMASIRHKDITIDGLTFDGGKRVRGIDFSQASSNISNIKIRNCLVKNTSSEGFIVRPRSGKKLSNITIERCRVDGTGYRGVGEAVYIGDDKPKKRGGKVVVNVEKVTLKNNKFTRFTDNCVDMKPSSRRVTMTNNTCENQVKARRGRQHGTIVVRGFDHTVKNNKINNVRAGHAVFNVAAKGGSKISNNTIKKTIATEYAIKTREKGYGSKSSSVTNNSFSQSVKRISAKFGLKVSGNKFR